MYKVSLQKANSLIKKMEIQNHEVHGFVKNINEIAQQLHLLTLNTKLKASQLGESGKYFVIVASEMKILSEQLLQITQRISKKIDFIHNGTNISTQSISEISNSLDKIYQFTENLKV